MSGKITKVEDGIRQMILVAEYNIGYNYSAEAEADSMSDGHDHLVQCVKYHNEQAKLWEQVKKNWRVVCHD